MTFPEFVDTGSSGLALCLIGRDNTRRQNGADGDCNILRLGKRATPGSIPGFVASPVHEFGFDRAKQLSIDALPFADYSVKPCPAEPLIGFAQLSFAAHGLDDPGSIRDLAAISGRILAAANANPASHDYGVPILDVEHAKDVLFLKRGLDAGYADVEHELFFQTRPCFLATPRR
jgi:NAD(P) transhydrogenase beta subunit